MKNLLLILFLIFSCGFLINFNDAYGHGVGSEIFPPVELNGKLVSLEVSSSTNDPTTTDDQQISISLIDFDSKITFSSNKLQITFSGLSYLNVGHTVDITVPAPEKVLEQNPGKIKNPEDLADKYLSGVYLITALRHMIVWNNGKPAYFQVAEVTKDALKDAPAYG